MYDKAIEKLKVTQVELLKELDRICKKHNIKYQLFAGTLLGAVRHKGFIPWDDDIDVCMLRDDYEKFVKVVRVELNDKYLFEHPKSKNSAFAFGKLRKSNTKMLENYLKDVNTSQEIYIDIFQMDKVFPNTIKGFFQRFRLNHLHNVRRSKLNKKHKNPLKNIVKLFYSFIYRKPYHYYSYKIDKLAAKNEHLESNYVAHLTSGRVDKRYIGFLYSISDFENHIYIDFEKKLYPAPRRYHELLTMQYGDYMTPPPIEEQKPHHGVIKISFDDEVYDIYEENGTLKATLRQE